jgi:hypothetical protein
LIVLTLLEKIYSKNKQIATQSIQENIRLQLSKLKVKLNKVNLNSRGWLQVEIVGEDEAAAAKYLAKRYGSAPIHINKINTPSLIRGRIINTSKLGNGLHIDVGVMYPEQIDCFITLNKLRSQLTDGENLSINQIRNLFCLQEHVPLEVLLTKITPEKNEIKAELTQSIIKTFYEWVGWRFDRIIICGANQTKVKHVVDKANVKKYLNKIEKLGFFEQSLICKIGVDAPGIIFKIGQHLKSVPMYVFSPRRIMTKLGHIRFKKETK